MPKKAKIGKQRKDKYYQLAKETGYRSRAAFKLIQLNRKFGFLQKSQICIDLCAAPGGWMQVAEKNMPASAVIVGVDLFPIPPIPRCISLVEDITTDQCRLALSRTLKTRKADLVLNDGAPNVGKNWIHDAYSQITLTLSALKLATQFLRPGGCFVTKVFRSADYNALIWVLKQLFKKVHATKPQASRAESAEIFVVCENYLAPDKIDPKFLDPKHVFAEIDVKSKNAYSILCPEKTKKKKAQGYEEGDITQYHEITAEDFIGSANAITKLQDVTAIVFHDDWIANHPRTTKEIKECCKDIKVLGKAEIKALLKWWKHLNAEKTKEPEAEKVEEIEEKATLTQEELEDLEEIQVQEEIKKLQEEETKEQKKKRKKVLKDRQKLQEKMNLHMVIKGDEGPREEDSEMFNLKQIRTMEDLDRVTNQEADILAESEEESEEERPTKTREYYDKDSGKLDSSGLFYRDDESEVESEKSEMDSDESGLGLEDSDEEEDKKDVRRKRIKPKYEGEDTDNPLITDLDYRDKKTKRLQKAEMWFEKNIFKDLENEKDEDFEIDRMTELYKKKGGKIIGEDSEMDGDTDSEEEKSDDGEDSDYDIRMMAPETKEEKEGFEVVSKKETEKTNKKKRKLTDEELALGSMMAGSKKARRDLVDAAWNRYAFNDDNLPDWFVEDEKKNMSKGIVVPEEIMGEYTKRVGDLNTRPIKKVMQAKARKKKRALERLEKAKKKTEDVLGKQELSEQEKAKQIKAIYKKAQAQPKKDVKYVVVKKHSAAKRLPRPKGVVGRYKLVDQRMKKDLRSMKNKEKTKNRGKRARKPNKTKK